MAMETKKYIVKLPSYAKTQSCRILIADNINSYTRKIVEDMKLKWNEQYNGVDLIRCGPSLALLFYFPKEVSNKKIDEFVKKLNELFLKEWK